MNSSIPFRIILPFFVGLASCGSPAKATVTPTPTNKAAPTQIPTPAPIATSLTSITIDRTEILPKNAIFQIPGEWNPGDTLDLTLVLQDDNSGEIEVQGSTKKYTPSSNNQARIALSLDLPADLTSNEIPILLHSEEDLDEYTLVFTPGSDWSPWALIEEPFGHTGEVSLQVRIIDLNGSESVELVGVEQEFNFQDSGEKDVAEFISNQDLKPFTIHEVEEGMYTVVFTAKWPGRFPLHFILSDTLGNTIDQRLPIEVYWSVQPFEMRGIGTGWIVPGDPAYYDTFFERLEHVNVNLLQILVAGHMESIRSNEVRDCEHTWTPDSICTGVSNTSAGRLIQEAHKRGIAVMLAPQVVPGEFDPTWQIRPTSWEAWFSLQPTDASYSNWILDWAEFAEENGVEIFSVGNELTPSHRFKEHWENLVSAVREVYSGTLTYADNYWVFWHNSEYEPFPACSALDLQGVNFYFRGSGDLYAGPARSDPTPDQIYENLANQVDRMLLPFRESSCSGIPILITEMGMGPIDGANTRPESSDFGHPIRDHQEQVDFFTMVWALATEEQFSGVVVWQLQPQPQPWSGIPGIPGDLRGLPAMDAMRIFFETP